MSMKEVKIEAGSSKKAQGNLEAANKQNESKKANSSSKSSSTSSEELPSPGDIVQIKEGGIDVTNGVVMKQGWKYCANGGSLWGQVKDVVKNWSTGSKYGLAAKVTKVRITDMSGGTIIWQVRPEDVVPKVKKEKKSKTATEEKKEEETKEKKKKKKKKSNDTTTEQEVTVTDNSSEPTENKQTEDEIMESNYALVDSSKVTITKGKATKAAKGMLKRNINAKAKYGGLQVTVKNGTPERNEAAMKRSSEHYEKNTIYFDKEEDGSKKAVLDIPSSVEGVFSLQTSNSNFKKEKKKHYLQDENDRKNLDIYDETKRGIRSVNVESYKPESSNEKEAIAKMYNDDPTVIQNAYQFPYTDSSMGGTYNDNNKETNYETASRTYDYQIIPGDTRFKNSPVATLERRMAAVRADLGLPVHGSQDLARSMKMYTYNRYKVPDINMAYSKTFTHVFFTRPDVNLLMQSASGEILPNGQARNHTDTAFMWRRNPELFKLLTDCSRCGDSNNFNFLLSNNVNSFTLSNEGITTLRSQKSWNEHEMVYGGLYNGKIAGEFSCTFDETNEYSIINLMKLWITYIANVGNGAWSPRYPSYQELKDGRGSSHVFDRAIDYAASAYVFKCGPNGSDVLYWSKYYGVFPIVNGAEALSWDKSSGIGDNKTVTINFAYCYKRDWNPISLIEFNALSGIDSFKGSKAYVDAWDFNTGAISRPFVGAPFIEISFGDPVLDDSTFDDTYHGKRTEIRLRYAKDPKGGVLGRTKDGASVDLNRRSDWSLFASYNRDRLTSNGDATTKESTSDD